MPDMRCGISQGAAQPRSFALLAIALPIASQRVISTSKASLRRGIETNWFSFCAITRSMSALNMPWSESLRLTMSLTKPL